MITPVGYNFDMPVHLKVWDGLPPNDSRDWTTQYTTKLEVSSGSLQLESTGGESNETPMNNGEYEIEIAGRNFPESLSIEPAEQWRLRLWPKTGKTTRSNSDIKINSASIGDSAQKNGPSQLDHPVEIPSPNLHSKNSEI